MVKNISKLVLLLIIGSVVRILYNVYIIIDVGLDDIINYQQVD